MLLAVFYDGVEIHREEKIIYAKFLTPHRVISTCSAAGGIHDDLEFLYNHQSCEPAGHTQMTHRMISNDPCSYRELIASRYQLPHKKCATLGTAANMRYASIKRATFRDLEVVAVCTGGVEANATRAGDPASVFECNGSYERLEAHEIPIHGTINILLLINRELTPGAMVRAVITATEAKTAALQELAVHSLYSDGLATGTGTDQIGIGARIGTEVPLAWAGSHSVLGELIGRTVHDSVCETLALQNELTPERQRSAAIHLRRFGATRESIQQEICSFLDKDDAALLVSNFTQVERDPLVTAAVAALVHVRDKVKYGILPKSCIPELWASYGAQVAAAVSGDYTRCPAYRETLSKARYTFENPDLVRLAAHAIALGFQEKWI